jgi:HEAT repeat protein
VHSRTLAQEAYLYPAAMKPFKVRPDPPDSPGGLQPNPRFRAIRLAKLQGDVDTLVAALADPDYRTSAARYLADVGAEEAAPAVERLLDAGDPVVRAIAAKVLGRLGARGAVPRLIEVAERDPSDVVQSYAVEALRKLNDVRARPILEHIVATHDQVSLRRGAALALERVGNKRSVLVLNEALRREPLLRRLRYYRAIRAARRRP